MRTELRRAAWSGANLLDGEYRHFRREIELWSRGSARDAADARRRRLHRYLEYCRDHSAYWRERWPAEGLRFAPEEAEDVLRLLPPLRKNDLREHAAALRVAPDARRAGDGYPSIRQPRRMASGGSTGEPVEVTVDRTWVTRQRAMFDFFYSRCGMPPGTPFFYLWGRQTELREIRGNWRKVLASKLRGAIPIPVFSLTPAAVEEIRALIASRPDVRSAVCFTSAIDTLLAHASEEERPFRKLDRIFCGGALLTPQTRARLHRLLAAEVYDTYGSRDLGLMAHETPGHDGLSTAAPFNHVEVLRASGEVAADGEIGTVHITAVNNFACALLRVDMGDTARWHGDGGRTGLAGPRLTDLSGRVSEHLVGPSGATVDPSAVIHIVGVVLAPRWVRKFQLRQHAADDYELVVESWEASRSPEAEERLATDFAGHLSGLMASPVRMRVTVVAEIPLLPSGKHQYVVRKA